ncbi:MAG: hypothetical protein V1678_04700 [Candidatus Aenigmatarchaeota archaeon]
MYYQQGFGIHAKEKYCPMAGGSIKELKKDLKENLSKTPIGKSVIFYILNDEKMIIKGDRLSSGLGSQLKNAARRVRNFRKSDYNKSSDFHMVVSIDEYGADLNLYDSEKWKDPLYNVVLETVKHD